MNPYNRLKDEFREYAHKVEYRHRKMMWFYPKEDLAAHWSMYDLYQRAAAAEQLGYDVTLLPTTKGLEVWYVKRVPARPMVAL